jgi:hypothetical protein
MDGPACIPAETEMSTLYAPFPYKFAMLNCFGAKKASYQNFRRVAEMPALPHCGQIQKHVCATNAVALLNITGVFFFNLASKLALKSRL